MLRKTIRATITRHVIPITDAWYMGATDGKTLKKQGVDSLELFTCEPSDPISPYTAHLGRGDTDAEAIADLKRSIEEEEAWDEDPIVVDISVTDRGTV